jgi:4,5-DOPA dioxygenase extradiol
MQKMPAIFIGHGSPMNALEKNIYTESWKDFRKYIPEKPRAILIFSAHWITPGETRISMGGHPSMIYDIYGFPAELYRVNYPAPGSLEIAGEISDILLQAGI